MKISFKFLFTVCCAVSLSISAYAQVDFNQPAFARYGSDAASREKNYKVYSFFNEEYNAKNYGAATVHLKQLLTDIPSVHPNLYIRGAAMYKKLIASEKNSEKRQIYIDSLLILHDYRIENFGDDAKRGKSYILNEKIKDNINFMANQPDVVIENVDKILGELQSDVNVDMILVYFNYITQLYKNDMIETDVILEKYDALNKLADSSASAKKDEIKTSIEKLLMSSGAASCENLESIFKPQYEANPDDKDLIAKIASTLSKAECSSDFQLTIAEKYYTIEPSAAAAASLAFGFDKKGDIEKALKYYDEAIEKETDNTNKASFAISAAGASLINSNNSGAIQYARKAISINPENGMAYYILAQAQAGSLPNCGDFPKKAAFWIIVDNLTKARSLMDEDQKENATKLIATYSQYFPTKEDVFFNDLKAGDKYTVNCGSVSGTTTVRAK